MSIGTYPGMFEGHEGETYLLLYFILYMYSDREDNSLLKVEINYWGSKPLNYSFVQFYVSTNKTTLNLIS